MRECWYLDGSLQGACTGDCGAGWSAQVVSIFRSIEDVAEAFWQRQWIPTSRLLPVASGASAATSTVASRCCTSHAKEMRESAREISCSNTAAISSFLPFRLAFAVHA